MSAPRPEKQDRTGGFILIAALVAVMWLVEVFDALGGDPDSAGIRPRDPDGLVGVPLSPFLHGSWGHLIGNTIPFIVLGAAVALGGLYRVAIVSGIVIAIGGIGTWLTAPTNTIHIGASGMVFGFAAYLIARGAYSRTALHMLGGLAVIAIYGVTLASGFVPTPGVSWQGHLFGAVGGVVAARVLHRSRTPAAAVRQPA